jgi:serine/threonine-protein kinase
MGQHEYRAFQPESVQRALSHFAQAVEIDPQYAPAHAALAQCHAALCSEFRRLPAKEAMPLAREAAERALTLDPMLAEAHAVRGQILANFERRFRDAEAAFERAVELSPGDAAAIMGLAGVTAALGDTDEAIALAQRAIDRDPLNPPLRLTYAQLLWCARRFDEALEEQSRVIAFDPTLQAAHADRGSSLHYLGRYDDAVASWRTAVSVGQVPDDVFDEVLRAYAEGGIQAYWNRWLDFTANLPADFDVPPNWMWVPYAAIGDLDHAFEWLERDFEGRAAELAYIKVNPFFDPLRPDPRFRDLLTRMGLEGEPAR